MRVSGKAASRRMYVCIYVYQLSPGLQADGLCCRCKNDSQLQLTVSSVCARIRVYVLTGRAKAQ